MPRLRIIISMIDDDNRTLINHDWSPLGYEDFNNTALDARDPFTERNLLERIRTAIDRTLLRFARGERRRNTPREVATPVIDFSENYEIDEPRDVPMSVLDTIRDALSTPVQPLTQDERMALIGQVIPKEDERLLRPEPKPIKRPSRYERKPVI